jgi:hypothetical protein
MATRYEAEAEGLDGNGAAESSRTAEGPKHAED